MNVYQQLRLSIAFLILLALAPLGAAQAQVEVTSADPASAPQGTISLDVTNLSGSDRTDNLYTINAGDCIAALNGVGSVTTACAVTLISKGINARSVDWRPNWPSLLP